MSAWDRKTVPATAVSLIRRCEGVRLSAYKDSVGVWTIGIGSTLMLSGRRVQAGDKITNAQADELLAEQCEQWVTDVAKAVSWAINDMQASVLISFTHNLGANALSGSTLAKMANTGRLDLAGDQLNGWAVAGGAPQLGLLRRREYERRLFAGDATESQAAYDAVWSLGTGDLMPLYQRAFTEAKTWGWSPDTPAVALHAGAGVAVAAPKPLTNPPPSSARRSPKRMR